MKEFDLAKAKSGAPVCTREGRPVRIICWDADITWGDHKYPIVAIISDGNKVCANTIESYDEGGACMASEECPEDLMMAPVKHEGWVLIDHEGPHCIAHIYDTREEAEEDAEREIIAYSAIAHIEWEE